MLFLVGLGLWDEKDISIKGYDIVLNADEVYIEFYTSKLLGTSLEKLKKFFKKDVKVLKREDLEERCYEIINKAKIKNIVVLTPGDPVIATTHLSLKLEAKKSGVDTKIIHSAGITNAIYSLTGLHVYKFGKSATISYPYKNIISRVPIETIKKNREINAHTILYLDLHPKPMTIKEGITLLEKVDDDNILENCYGVGIARAGSDKPVVKCDKIKKLKNYDFGPPLHCLVVLAPRLHFFEFEYLKTFASAPDELESFVD